PRAETTNRTRGIGTGRAVRLVPDRRSVRASACSRRDWFELIEHRRRRGYGERMRVLILDGNENQAVACARSLSRAGHQVSVGADSAWSKAGWSNSCRSTFVYPAPQSDAGAFVA